MSKQKYLLAWSPFIMLLFLMLSPTVVDAQDLIFYPDKDFPEGQGIPMNLWDEIEFPNPIPDFSFIKYNPDVALKVEALGPVPTDVEHWNGVYKNMFFYSEEWKRSGIVGTDQYTKIPVRVRCVQRALPQPDIYVPIDRANAHPEAGPFPYKVTNKKMLFLKRAFFWENAEDLRCRLTSPHGPAGDIKIHICHKSAANYSIDTLHKFQHLWRISNKNGCEVKIFYNGSNTPFINSDCDSRLLEFRPGDFLDYFNFDYSRPFDTLIYLPRTHYKGSTIFGPFYVAPIACDEAGFLAHFNPGVPHNEWNDGPWGAVYSNVAVIDWDKITEDEVAIVVTEADMPKEIIGIGSQNLADVIGVFKVKKDNTEDILIPLGMSGWILLKNEKYNGKKVETVNHYWYPTWDALTPELTLGTKGNIKHFEDDSYKCNEIDDSCGPYHHRIIRNRTLSRIWRVNINPWTKDTFHTYLFKPDLGDCLLNFGFKIDTNYLYSVKSDSIIFFKAKPSTCEIYDTLYVTPSDLYRRWGSQYQPYYSYDQIKKYLHDGESIGIMGDGVIPPGHRLSKPMTLKPVDRDFKAHKELLDRWPDVENGKVKRE